MKRALFLATAMGYVSTGAIGIAAAQSIERSTSQAADPSTPALSSGPQEGIGEIIVTAQKRSENLQTVPVAVAVVTSAQLQASGIRGLADIKMAAPGVEVQNSNGYAFPIIRGVGSKANAPGVENPIAVYVDGVYYAAAPAALMNFNNIAQVEALKGPQGTLFGRNATGGLIQIITKDPKQEFGGEINLSYGNYDTKQGSLYLTGGISNNLSADIAFSGTAMGDGYGTNRLSGKDVYRIYHDINLRSKWLLDLGEQTQLRLIFDYSDTRNNTSVQRVARNAPVPPPFGPSFGGSPWDVESNVDPIIELEGGGASLRIDHDFGAVSLATITAYRKTDFFTTWDYDYTGTPGRQAIVTQKDHQFSQEVQLLSPSNQRITWVLGAYYFDAAGEFDPFSVRLFGPAQQSTPSGVRNRTHTFSRQGTSSISGFGQATAKLFGGLSATAGLRYTSERRTLDAVQYQFFTNGQSSVLIPQDEKANRFKKLTWRLALDYQFENGLLLYASYNRGFKSGGFNPTSLTIPPYDPEVLDSYEAGFKSSLFDRRVRFNSSFFYYDYKDIQVQIPAVTGQGIYNAASAHIYGAEAELDARVTEQLSIKLGYQYLHGRYTDFPSAQLAVPNPNGLLAITRGPATDNHTILSPKSTVSASANYQVPVGSGEMNFNLSYYYNSGYYHEPDNLLRQPSYSLVNASVRYESEDGFSFAIWGKNLGNKAVANYASVQNFGALGVERIAYAAPRTYGVTLGKTF